jgi:hypothetical protein
VGRTSWPARLAVTATAITLAVGAVFAGSPSAKAMGSLPPRAVTSYGVSVPGSLDSIDALSPDDVWAIGLVFGATSIGSEILHWNGVKWYRENVPFGTLYGLDAVSSNDVWAVGNEGRSALTMHWNGKKWSVQSNVPVLDGEFSAVAVIGDDVWAAGYVIDIPLIMHLVDGHWYLVPVPSPTNARNSFFSEWHCHDRSQQYLDRRLCAY